jgi:hypothetical protein
MRLLRLWSNRRFDKIEAHNMALRNVAYTQLVQLQSEIPGGLVVVSPPPGPLASPIITVGLPGNVTSNDVANAMAERFQTVVKVRKCAVLNAHYHGTCGTRKCGMELSRAAWGWVVLCRSLAEQCLLQKAVLQCRCKQRGSHFTCSTRQRTFLRWWPILPPL